jgi:hypothetical protein
MTSRPELCRVVAELIPGAQFEVLEDEAHQPFQEIPVEWNARVAFHPTHRSAASG